MGLLFNYVVGMGVCFKYIVGMGLCYVGVCIVGMVNHYYIYIGQAINHPVGLGFGSCWYGKLLTMG